MRAKDGSTKGTDMMRLITDMDCKEALDFQRRVRRNGFQATIIGTAVQTDVPEHTERGIRLLYDVLYRHEAQPRGNEMKYYSAIKAARYVMSKNGMTYPEAQDLIYASTPSRMVTYPKPEYEGFEFPEFSESDLDKLVKEG